MELVLPACTFVVGVSAADAVLDLSKGSAIGSLVADACAGLWVNWAVGAFAAAEDTDVIFREKHVIEP